jgi:hypothetical protein
VRTAERSRKPVSPLLAERFMGEPMICRKIGSRPLGLLRSADLMAVI